MDDLFATANSLEHLPIQGADVSYMPKLNLSCSREELLRLLIKDTPWRAESVVVWGKSHPQPRLIAWYGDQEQDYSYSGIKLQALSWTPLLQSLRQRVEAETQTTFNSVLLNYYRDHRDSMGFHSDDEPELGPRPVIASLSLGAERTFVLKPKRVGFGGSVKIPLGSGSLLVMKGDTQKNWKHGIEKETRPCGPRVNLTFRTILTRYKRNPVG